MPNKNYFFPALSFSIVSSEALRPESKRLIMIKKIIKKFHFYLLDLEHFLEQYFTLSQFKRHFFLHEKDLSQIMQIFLGKLIFFFTLKDAYFLKIKKVQLFHRIFLEIRIRVLL